MFRNFYEEQNMADPRDGWYKPNLLYNIHYKPPKQSSPPKMVASHPKMVASHPKMVALHPKIIASPPKIVASPPKMVVVTKEFNPSVCSCGKHGCKPHYRMEREVVWLKKEVKSKEGKEVKEKIHVERDERTETETEDCGEDDKNTNVDGNKVVQTDKKVLSNAAKEEGVYGIKRMDKGMDNKEVGVQVYSLTISEKNGTDGNGAGIETQKEDLRIEIDSAVQELEQQRKLQIENMEVEGKQRKFENKREFEKVLDIGNNEATELQNKAEFERKGEIIKELSGKVQYELCDGSSEKRIQHEDNFSVGGTEIKEENKKNDNKEFGLSIDGVIVEGNCSHGSSRFVNIASPDIPDISDIGVPDVTQSRVTLDEENEEYGSAFGIMRVFCDSELHIEWNGEASEVYGH